MINLSKILEEIRDDKEVSKLPVNEQMDYTTFRYLAEVLDKNNVYPYESTEKFSAIFQDGNGVKHFIRIIYQPLSNPRHDVKIGFFDKNGRPSFEKPNVHYNLNPDEKIFNTYIHILLDDFFDRSDFFGKAKTDSVALPATDYPRYRLYRMALTKFLDKSKYEFFDCPKHPNVIIIRKKQQSTQ